MRLRPFFTYTGAKHRLAPRYPQPQYDSVIEPFAGSAGYATLHYDKHVVLYDVDPGVVALWRYLISATAREVLSLPLYDGTWRSTDDLVWLSEGEEMLIRGWLNKGTFAKRPSTWMRNPEYSSQFWGENIRARVARQVPYIKHWEVYEQTYASVSNQKATWFVDPPYEVAGATYDYGSSGIDYAHLAMWCRSRRGQVIVCENVGAEWLPFQPFASAHAMQARFRSGRSEEAVWVSV